MKKINFLNILCLITLISCKNQYKPSFSDYYLDQIEKGYQIIETTNNDLNEKIKAKENFFFIVYLTSCYNCGIFRNQVLTPYCEENSNSIFFCGDYYNVASLLNLAFDEVTPILINFSNGEINEKISYKDNNAIFNDYKIFKSYIDNVGYF